MLVAFVLHTTKNSMQLTTFHNFYKPCISGPLQQNPAINDFSKKCKIYLLGNYKQLKTAILKDSAKRLLVILQ